MTIIASLGLLLTVSVHAQAQTCESNTFICSDCTSLDACFGGTVYPIPCTAGQVCGNDGADPNIDGCFDITDSSNTKASQCSCDPSATAPSYMADGLSEDPAAYLACLPGSSAPESLVCTGTDEVYLDGQVPQCGTAPTTTVAPTTEKATTPEPFACTDTGFFRDSSSCSKYWLCQDATDTSPTEAECDAGQSFNEATLACFDPCDPSAETFSCAGITSGGVVDSIDCSIFHICVNEVAIGVPIPCADGEIFDGAACVTGTDCPSASDSCLACSATTAPSTTAGVTGATPDADASTSGSGASTSGSDASTSGSDSSTSGSDSSTSGPDSSSSSSGSDSSTSGSGSSTAGSDSTKSTLSGSSASNGSPSSNSPTSESPSIPTTASGSTTGGLPDCSSASQAGYYDNSANCNVFYSCEDDDAGGFILKEYTCPGSLVFDPTNNYCNLASLVPGC